MTTKLKVLDLYSGIGGFSLGFHRAGGFETVGFCEIDEHCEKVLKKNFPDVYIYKDVKEFHGNMNIKIEDSYIPFKNNVDVICGGFPCQDVSVAGKQRGLIDEEGKRTRSGLWFEFKRIIKEIRPRWVIIENVRNLLNNGLATVLQDLHEIGYDCEWQIISARDIGANHLRERIWVVAWPSRKNSIKPIPSLNGYHCDNNGVFYSSVRGGIKPIKLKTNKSGYVYLEITKNNKKEYYLAHRLVAETFLKFDVDSDLQINHKNFIKNDNRVSNLEIVTSKENVAHSIGNGVAKHGLIQCVLKCLNNEVVYNSIKEAGEILSLSRSEISRQLSGEISHVKGYRFEKIFTRKSALQVRSDGGRKNIGSGEYLSKEGDVFGASDSKRKRLERLFQKRRDRREMGKEQEEECASKILHKKSSDNISDSYDFRFWPTFTSEEEKQQWWAEATSGFSDWWEVESRVCRVVDGLSPKLDKGRSQRIKQLGNSIVPQIAELIGKRIMYHEGL